MACLFLLLQVEMCKVIPPRLIRTQSQCRNEASRNELRSRTTSCLRSIQLLITSRAEPGGAEPGGTRTRNRSMNRCINNELISLLFCLNFLLISFVY